MSVFVLKEQAQNHIESNYRPYTRLNALHNCLDVLIKGDVFDQIVIDYKGCSPYFGSTSTRILRASINQIGKDYDTAFKTRSLGDRKISVTRIR